MKWIPGRQQSCPYRKMRLWEIGSSQLNLFSDAYLIEYPPNAKLPLHTDAVQKGRHYRLNIELRGRGEFLINRCIFRLGPVVLFRPDLEKHGMNNGPTTRLVLSFGFLL